MLIGPTEPEVLKTEAQELIIGSLEYMKRVLTSDTVKHLIAGGAAGAVSRTIVSPLERMKILFQASSNTCLLDCVHKRLFRMEISLHQHFSHTYPNLIYDT